MTPAVEACRAAGVAFTVHEYARARRAHAGGYGIEAAEAMGIDPERVFKTLVAEVDGALTVAVVPVARSLDLRALAAAAGGKRARMADATVAERTTGYVLGGISPLGQRKRLPTIVDVQATALDTVFVSGGRRGLEIELAPNDLVALTAATVAPVASP